MSPLGALVWERRNTPSQPRVPTRQVAAAVGREPPTLLKSPGWAQIRGGPLSVRGLPSTVKEHPKIFQNRFAESIFGTRP